MMKSFVSGLMLSALVGCGVAQQGSDAEVKSLYPDMYPVNTKTKTVTEMDAASGLQKEVIRIERSEQKDGGTSLLITYAGFLAQQTPAGVKAYVKVNEPGGTFRAYEFPVKSAGKRSSVFFLSSTCYEGKLDGCKIRVDDALKPAADAEMEKLLTPGLRRSLINMKALLAPTVGPVGKLHELDLEIAFTDGHGNWDSKHGANYRFEFPADPY